MFLGPRRVRRKCYDDYFSKSLWAIIRHIDNAVTIRGARRRCSNNERTGSRVKVYESRHNSGIHVRPPGQNLWINHRVECHARCLDGVVLQGVYRFVTEQTSASTSD